MGIEVRPKLLLRRSGRADLFALLSTFYHRSDLRRMWNRLRDPGKEARGRGRRHIRLDTMLFLRRSLSSRFSACNCGGDTSAWFCCRRISMKTTIERRGLMIAGLVLVLAAGYFSTIGHCFLPRRNPKAFLGEQLEVRTFSGLVIPDQSKTLAGLFARTKWRLLRPGQARLLAAAEKIEKNNPRADHILRRSLEELGYAFPPGCDARSGDNLALEITHYPSMLNGIAKDLQLKVSWRAVIGPDGDPLPNPAVQRTGASRSASQTNRESVAAGSGR